MNDAAFQTWAKNLENCYAYSLGYRQSGQLIGMRLDDTKPSALMPLVADSSPLDPMRDDQSLSHGGAGQPCDAPDAPSTVAPRRRVGEHRAVPTGGEAPR